jgi:photosystem II stability/assembly factor-like uncharacterized protein
VSAPGYFVALMRLLPLIVSCGTLAAPLAAQWTIQRSGTVTEFRGLHAVSDRIVWAAGRGGVVARTTDGGNTWQADSIPGAASLFLVAVRALDRRRAWVLGTAFNGPSLARIYRTDDGGRTWRMQYENATPGVFLDGMMFWDPDHGIAFGDPMDGRFFLLVTGNGGNHWDRVPPARSPAAAAGEAAFAASGTAITIRGKREVWIGTGGGARARVLRSGDRGRSWNVFPTPQPAGPARGIFGLAFWDKRHGVAVGGDYQNRESSSDNLMLSDDGGATWRMAASPGLTGVQYGVADAGRRTLVAVGPTGSSITNDGGITWRRLEGPGFNTVSCAAAICWAAGVDGRVARLRPVR